MNIRNAAVDEHTSGLVTEVFDTLPAFWLAILPTVEVRVSMTTFNKVTELQEFCESQNSEPGRDEFSWDSIHVICPQFDDREVMIWVYYDRKSMMQPPDYYFQKELFSVLAKLMWSTSEELQKGARGEATGMTQNSEGAAYIAFRDSFSRFFLNPEYLIECKPAAWAFMNRLNARLRDN